MYRQRADGTDAVRRYTLRRDLVGHRVNGVRVGRTQLSSGSIDMCDDCWQSICAPRMNPRKSHPR